MTDRAPYSRVYWSIQDDPKFDGIREDQRLLGSWLTLLVVADQAWPAPAYPPPIVAKSAVKALCAAGLIDPLPGGRYRVHGLDPERMRRQSKARASASAKWSERGPSASVTDTERDAATRAGASSRLVSSSLVSSPETDRARDDEPEWPVLSWMASVHATVQPNGNGYHRDLLQLVERQGAPAVLMAMQGRYAAGDRSARQLIYGASNDLEPIARQTPKPKGLGPTIVEAERAFNR